MLLTLNINVHSLDVTIDITKTKQKRPWTKQDKEEKTKSDTKRPFEIRSTGTMSIPCPECGTRREFLYSNQMYCNEPNVQSQTYHKYLCLERFSG